VADAESALRLLTDGLPDVVLLDVRLPGMSGLDLLRVLRERAPKCRVIMMSAWGDRQTVHEAMRAGALDFLGKPVDPVDLRSTVDAALDTHAPVPPAVPRPGADGTRALIGRSPAMVEVFKRIDLYAPHDVTVLITGETGTGKELIAREIHRCSPRCEDPFVPVDCTAIPHDLVESELFGHMPGAFTGANMERKGYFALAGCGTIFLDEIGETNSGFQSKLLRVLQEGVFWPVGAESAHRTRARVIFASNRDLLSMVMDARFRLDLYHRIRVCEIRVPPLRERMTDVPELARYFADEAARELSIPNRVLSQAAVRALLSWKWQGNVRELRHCVHRSPIHATAGVIRPQHLELAPPTRDRRLEAAISDGKENRRGHDSDRMDSLRTNGHWDSANTFEQPETERQLGKITDRSGIIAVLRETRGNKRQAALRLGISRGYLYDRIRFHGIRDSEWDVPGAGPTGADVE
jgi:two-component system nitrogen regulation response regulator GlnG